VKLKYQIAMAVTGILLILVPYLFRHRAPRFIKSFFTAASSPVNLAIFRVVFFTLVLFSFSVSGTTWFANLPAELRFPPFGLSSLTSRILFNEQVAWYAAVTLVIACAACIVGLFTRTSTVISLVLSIYVLGLPQFFGKINHYHHLIWFMAILAVSPCADVLSIDAIFKSWKRADRGQTDPPAASQAYALPLRFVWLLMGVIYFSAGFWKLWTGGYRWAWSDNPRNMMYNKWMEFDGWKPLFRIDHYPMLYKLSGLATLAFEFVFIALIFFASVRWLAPLGGLVFHNMTNFFMRIWFWNLQGCYVAFVDWAGCFKSLGARLFKSEMYVLYDGNCRLCRRTIASLRTFDLFDRVTYVNALDRPQLEADRLAWLDQDALMQEMHVVVGKRAWRGFDAYRAWLKRMPALWPLLPILYLWPVTRLGRAVYRRVAESRACQLIDKANSLPPLRPKSLRWTTAVGGALFYVSVLFAVGKVHSWPLSAYPNFEDLDEPQVNILTIVTENAKGEDNEVRPIRQQALEEFGAERLMGLQNRLLAIDDRTERTERLRAFWQLYLREEHSPNNAQVVRFYRDTVSSIPDDNRLIKRELVCRFGFDSEAMAKVSK
jgi:predicted DCC family thiol-disulfide oxidoreductase YuxK